MDKDAMTDEQIMAFADGEVSSEEAVRIERALAGDPEARRKLKMFRETATALKAGGAKVPPVSEALAQRIDKTIQTAGLNSAGAKSENVVPLPQRSWVRLWPTALAASICLAVGLGIGANVGDLGTPPGDPALGVVALADPAIGDALTSMPSGTNQVLPTGATLNVIASFQGEDGSFCREFDYESPDGLSLVSVACRDGVAWQPKIAIAASGQSNAQYAPASSLEALETWLATSGLGEPLDAAAERELLGDVR